jgi:hypothetical protein
MSHFNKHPKTMFTRNAKNSIAIYLIILLCCIMVSGCVFYEDPAPVYNPDGHINNVFTYNYTYNIASKISYLEPEKELSVRIYGDYVNRKYLEDTLYFSIEKNQLSILSKPLSTNHFKSPLHDSNFTCSATGQFAYVYSTYTSDSLAIMAGSTGYIDHSGVGTNSVKAAFEIKNLKTGKDTLFTFGECREYSYFQKIKVIGQYVFLAGTTNDAHGKKNSPSYINFAVVNLETMQCVCKLLSFKSNDGTSCSIECLIISPDLAIFALYINKTGTMKTLIGSIPLKDYF